MSVVFSAVTDRRYISRHPAEHGIEFNVVVAVPHSLERGNFRPFPFANQLIQRLAKGGNDSKETPNGNHYFGFSDVFSG